MDSLLIPIIILGVVLVGEVVGSIVAATIASKNKAAKAATAQKEEAAPAEKPVEEVDEAPVAEEVKEEAAEESVAEETKEEAAEEPVAEEASEEAVEEPAAEEVNEEAAEEPAAEEANEEAAQEPVAEETAEEAVEEKSEEAAEDEGDGPDIIAGGAADTTFEDVAYVRYRKGFMARLSQAPDKTKGYYGEIKNALLGYAKIKDRLSWDFEAYTSGRNQIARIAVKGKTLVLYLALSPASLQGTKYIFEDVSGHGKTKLVPTMLRLTSDRAVRWAKELIAKTMEENGLEAIERADEVYDIPYEEMDVLIEKGYVKVILAGGVESADTVEQMSVKDLISGKD